MIRTGIYSNFRLHVCAIRLGNQTIRISAYALGACSDAAAWYKSSADRGCRGKPNQISQPRLAFKTCVSILHLKVAIMGNDQETVGDRRPGCPMEFPLMVFVSRDRHIPPPSERETYRAEHHEAMKKRDESMGLSLPDQPPTYGPGLGRGGPGYWGPGYGDWYDRGSYKPDYGDWGPPVR